MEPARSGADNLAYSLVADQIEDTDFLAEVRRLRQGLADLVSRKRATVGGIHGLGPLSED
jgi:hypothetical protein